MPDTFDWDSVGPVHFRWEKGIPLCEALAEVLPNPKRPEASMLRQTNDPYLVTCYNCNLLLLTWLKSKFIKGK